MLHNADPNFYDSIDEILVVLWLQILQKGVNFSERGTSCNNLVNDCLRMIRPKLSYLRTTWWSCRTTTIGENVLQNSINRLLSSVDLEFSKIKTSPIHVCKLTRQNSNRKSLYIRLFQTSRNIYRLLLREEELRETHCLYEEIYSGGLLQVQTFNLKMEKYEGKYEEI